jgi:hypothetical protein
MKELSSVLCGSSSCTEIRKKRVPNLAAPLEAASSRYSARMPIVSVPKSGKKASKKPRYLRGAQRGAARRGVAQGQGQGGG